jgi:hypothetical protein
LFAIVTIDRTAEILSFSDEDFHPFMKDRVPELLDADKLMQIAFSLSLSHKDIDTLSAEYDRENKM